MTISHMNPVVCQFSDTSKKGVSIENNEWSKYRRNFSTPHDNTAYGIIMKLKDKRDVNTFLYTCVCKVFAGTSICGKMQNKVDSWSKTVSETAHRLQPS